MRRGLLALIGFVLIASNCVVADNKIKTDALGPKRLHVCDISFGKGDDVIMCVAQGKRLHTGPGRQIAWHFVNQTGSAISVQVKGFHDPNNQQSCVITPMLDSGEYDKNDCAITVATIKDGSDALIWVQLDRNNTYQDEQILYSIFVGPDKEHMQPVDPDLIMDDSPSGMQFNPTSTGNVVSIVLGAIASVLLGGLFGWHARRLMERGFVRRAQE
jgi:hypothetical protein